MGHDNTLMIIMQTSRKLIEKHPRRMFASMDCFSITITDVEVALWNGQGKLFASVMPYSNHIDCSLPWGDFLIHIQSTLARFQE